MRLLGVSGSLRAGSHNSALLRAAIELAPSGVHIEPFAGLKAVEPFDADDEPGDHLPGVVAWREALHEHDAVLFVTPEYNATIPGQLKNAIDWASRPVGEGAALWAKPVVAIGSSPSSYGAAWAQADLRKALAKAGARVLPHELSVPRANERFDENGALISRAIERRLSELLLATAADLEQLLVR
jgi:chromate reductase, NAD(P)H dehydrogenase (quinone)